MALRLSIENDTSWYAAYNDVTLETLELTERELAVIASFFIFALEREAWQPMNDTEWDSHEAYIAQIMEALQ